MTSHTNDTLLKCHKSGVRLSASWVTYAHPDLKKDWQALQNTSAVSTLEKDMLAASEEDGPLIEKLAKGFSGTQILLGERSKLERQLKTNILSYIKQGHLRGFAFEAPRKLASSPVELPKEAWAGRVDWNTNKLTFEGLEFLDVRLTTNTICNEVLRRGQVDPTPTNAQGRPSTAVEIKEAFEALANAGAIDPSRSLSSHYPSVREWLQRHKPHMQPPAAYVSDKTLHRHLSSLFNALKKVSNL